MNTKICQNCDEPGPWQRRLSADIIQEVRGIDDERQLRVATVDSQVQEGRSFECLNCGWRCPAPLWWNGLEEVVRE